MTSTSTSRVRAVVLMERGEPLVEQPTREHTIDELLQNTEDAYTFPPFATFAPLLVIGGLSNHELLARERELLRQSIEPANRVRIRVRGHNWSELLPDILAGTMPTMETLATLPDPEEDAGANGATPAVAAISREEIDPRTVGSSARPATRDGGR